ncbi:MAG TPA: ketosteroid isomerase [Methanobacteriaceae archaeon]|nr:ketosteroid isomerase [Methanobacteriaceae archaeon]
MTISLGEVQKLFNNLKFGNSGLFFDRVTDDVHWTVMGTHPLAGTYHSKQEFLSHTFKRLNKILQEGVFLQINNIILNGNIAVVEMESLSTAKNGKPFNNTYCWIVYFKDDYIVKVRAYVDSALVKQVIDENE